MRKPDDFAVGMLMGVMFTFIAAGIAFYLIGGP